MPQQQPDWCFVCSLFRGSARLASYYHYCPLAAVRCLGVAGALPLLQAESIWLLKCLRAVWPLLINPILSTMSSTFQIASHLLQLSYGKYNLYTSSKKIYFLTVLHYSVIHCHKWPQSRLVVGVPLLANWLNWRGKFFANKIRDNKIWSTKLQI